MGAELAGSQMQEGTQMDYVDFVLPSDFREVNSDDFYAAIASLAAYDPMPVCKSAKMPQEWVCKGTTAIVGLTWCGYMFRDLKPRYALKIK